MTIIFFIIFNFILTLINLYIVFKLWQLRQWLAKITITFWKIELIINSLLSLSPEMIYQNQRGIIELRRRYRSLHFQSIQFRQILKILIFGYQFLQKQSKTGYILKMKVKYR